MYRISTYHLSMNKRESDNSEASIIVLANSESMSNLCQNYEFQSREHVEIIILIINF